MSLLAHLSLALAGIPQPTQTYSFDSADYKLFFTLTGSGPLLVIQAPGWGIGDAYLQSGLAPLAKSHTLLFLLPRGTAPSSCPESTTEMRSVTMAFDLESLRVWLEVPSLALLGHSNGGAVALAYAEMYPERVERLVLVSPQILGFNDSATWIRFFGERKEDPRYAGAIETMKGGMDPQTDEELKGLLKGLMPYYFAQPERYAEKFYLQLEEAAKDSQHGSVQVSPFKAQGDADRADKEGVTGLFGRVICKTLLLVGDQDAFCSVAAAKVAEEGIKGGGYGEVKLVVLENCGHFPWVEKGDVFFDFTEKFLDAQE
ncbi:alpha/beta-hydrolase [Glonium stellatum]|uniref:Alpha/beta-hydrolase n=1 Tax=Glonium stellatum TaxID=574774 RepID=A0A8E2F990_9PEZI|nr:alpha/beta-hydrolase [Glonium stellatum]